MKRKYFGTDGVRGRYNDSLLTDSFSFQIGKAVGQWLLTTFDHPRVVIGRDTRESGPALRDGLARGFKAAGAIEVLDLGILPTPAVPVYVRNVQASLGVVITASHNPAEDNGIKFFSAKGLKLSDDIEMEIESLVDVDERPVESIDLSIETAINGSAGYLDLLQPVLGPGSLEGMTILLDTANGATFRTSPSLLTHLGATVVSVGNEPNGVNINEGVGSQYPEHLSRQVLDNGADLGIAHDGDGDRVLVCDEKGQVVDGDVLLFILACQELKKGRLAKDTLVATVQSNLGLDRALKEMGVRLVRTSVGDRYVLEEMLRSGYNLGGENSGHIIFSDINPSGDGLLSALKLLSVLIEEGKSMSDLQRCMTLFPQRTGALTVAEKIPLEDLPEIQDTLRFLETEMADEGRVLLRYSGTEPKIRLLIEGVSAEKVDKWYQTLEYRIKQHLT